jgi:hypothetical protein
MKHSTQELIATAYEYYPQEIPSGDPRYDQTPEVLRQREARVLAVARYKDWRSMLRRLTARFPEEQFPGVIVQNNSLEIEVATSELLWHRCFAGFLWHPVHTSKESHLSLIFLISFVVPYYTIYSERHVFNGRMNVFNGRLTPKVKPSTTVERSFNLSPDELPFAKAIEEEIRTTFPDHEPILPEVGLTVVPNVQAGNKWFGESTIFTCLFSDRW